MTVFSKTLKRHLLRIAYDIALLDGRLRAVESKTYLTDEALQPILDKLKELNEVT